MRNITLNPNTSAEFFIEFPNYPEADKRPTFYIKELDKVIISSQNCVFNSLGMLQVKLSKADTGKLGYYTGINAEEHRERLMFEVYSWENNKSKLIEAGSVTIAGFIQGAMISEVEILAGEDIGENLPVYLLNDKIYQAKNLLVDMGKIIGITKTTAIIDTKANIITKGLVSNVAWAWDYNKGLYLGEHGGFIQDVSDTMVYMQSLGAISSPNSIYLNIGIAIQQTQ